MTRLLYLPGVDLEFVNQRSDTIHATVNRSINVTFKVVWRNCSSNAGNILIKILSTGGTYSKDECKLTLNVNHCNASTSSSACYCVTSAGPVTFSKTFTHVTNVTYRWTWGSGVKDRSIVFIVTNYSNYGKNLHILFLINLYLHKYLNFISVSLF